MSSLPAPREFATPALADQWEADALAAIEAAKTPEDVEAVLARIKVVESMTRLLEDAREREARWKRIALMAERRLGELLGPAKPGRPYPSPEDNVPAGDVTSGQERHTRHRARLVAGIPEADFTDYVENAEKPSRAGLLRETSPRKVNQQHNVVSGIAEKARRIAELEHHIDLEAIASLPEEEKAEWKLQLSAARTVLSRVIGAL